MCAPVAHGRVAHSSLEALTEARTRHRGYARQPLHRPAEGGIAVRVGDGTGCCDDWLNLPRMRNTEWRQQGENYSIALNVSQASPAPPWRSARAPRFWRQVRLRSQAAHSGAAWTGH